MKINEFLLKILRKLKHIYDYFVFKYRHPKIQILHPGKVNAFYSQHGQDIYLATLLFNLIKDERKGMWVVDVGCNHPINFSNSFLFERHFNISVLAIDAIEEFRDMWAAERPNAKFIASAVGESSGVIELNLPMDGAADNMFSFVENGFNKKPEISFHKRMVKLSTLSDLMSDCDVKEVLFISIDIEGFELNALMGIDFDSVKIYCVILENNSNSSYGSESIREFLKLKDFSFYSRIGMLDDVYLNNKLFDINGANLYLKGEI